MPFQQFEYGLTVYIAEFATVFEGYFIQQVAEMESDGADEMHRHILIAIETKHIVPEEILEAFINEGLHVVAIRRGGEYLGKTSHIDIGVGFIVDRPEYILFGEAILVQHEIVCGAWQLSVEKSCEQPAAEITAAGLVAQDIAEATGNSGVDSLPVIYTCIRAGAEDTGDAAAAIIGSQGGGLQIMVY
jgi:hypothetical protein